MFQFNTNDAKWFFKPQNYRIEQNRIEIVTEPNTDFWQRTYYNFRNDNAHVLYNTIDEKYFSFTVKAEFNSRVLFDQCGVVIYQNSDNWIKAGIEYHDDNHAWLGSVVTNYGFSDWATTDIGSGVSRIWYRLSRRESDYCLESSFDGKVFKQMRIFHFFEGGESINVGVYACSPGNSSFKAVFTDIQVTECVWKEHKV